MIKTLQGFRSFIMRGNVIDLAVGIVIGAAFTGVVTSFTGSFIEPLLKVFGAGDRTAAGAWHLGGQIFTWAAFANSLVTFMITAAVLYFLVVLPMNKLAERRHRGEEPAPVIPSEEILLLRQIRDALVAGAAVPTPRTGTATSTQRTDTATSTPRTATATSTPRNGTGAGTTAQRTGAATSTRRTGSARRDPKS